MGVVVGNCMMRIKGFSDFVMSFESLGNIKNYNFTAALLYTGEDIGIAKYIREHYDALDKVSGHHTAVFVIEKPYASLSDKQKENPSVRNWLKNFSLHNMPPASVAYDKNETYEIASRLGLLANQIPCLVFFYDLDQSDKICIPLPEHEFTAFFRNIFSYVTLAVRDADTHLCDLQVQDKLEKQMSESDSDWYQTESKLRFEYLRKQVMSQPSPLNGQSGSSPSNITPVFVEENRFELNIEREISIKNIHSALLSAYRSTNDLQQMVKFGLNENLAAIVKTSNLENMIFDLLMWAEQYGRMDELVKSAYENNPGNSELRFVARKYLGKNTTDSGYEFVRSNYKYKRRDITILIRNNPDAQDLRRKVSPNYLDQLREHGVLPRQLYTKSISGGKGYFYVRETADWVLIFLRIIDKYKISTAEAGNLSQTIIEQIGFKPNTVILIEKSIDGSQSFSQFLKTTIYQGLIYDSPIPPPQP